MYGTRNTLEVDAIQKHRERSGVDGHLTRIVIDIRQTESPSVEAFVINDKPAAIIKKNFQTIFSSTYENKKVPVIRIQLPRILDESEKAIVAFPQVGCFRGQVYSYGGRKGQHRRRSSEITCARYWGEVPTHARTAISATHTSIPVPVPCLEAAGGLASIG